MSDVSELLRSLTKNERMSESLIFLSESLICSFLGKKRVIRPVRKPMSEFQALQFWNWMILKLNEKEKSKWLIFRNYFLKSLVSDFNKGNNILLYRMRCARHATTGNCATPHGCPDENSLSLSGHPLIDRMLNNCLNNLFYHYLNVCVPIRKIKYSYPNIPIPIPILYSYIPITRSRHSITLMLHRQRKSYFAS